MTIYQRILHHHESTSFRFTKPEKMLIGRRVNELWLQAKPGQKPPKVQSKEDSGTYQVLDYTEDFTSMIDQMIRNVHREAPSLRAKRKGDRPVPESKKPLQRLPRQRIPASSVPVYKQR